MAVALGSGSLGLEIEPLDSRDRLNHFLNSDRVNPYPRFFHTWEWGDFNRGIGYKTHRFAIVESGDVIATVLMVEMTDRFGTYMYVPRGPPPTTATDLRWSSYCRH